MPHRHGLTSGSSGFAEIIGDDMIVSLQCFNFPDYVRNTIMHELGHNLGLHHGGFGDATNLEPNYNSVMNYLHRRPPLPLRSQQRRRPVGADRPRRLGRHHPRLHPERGRGLAIPQVVACDPAP